MERTDRDEGGHSRCRDQPGESQQGLGDKRHLHQGSVYVDGLPLLRLHDELEAVGPRASHENSMARSNTEAHDRGRSRLTHRIARSKVEAQDVLGVGAAESKHHPCVPEVIAGDFVTADAAGPGYLRDLSLASARRVRSYQAVTFCGVGAPRYGNVFSKLSCGFSPVGGTLPWVSQAKRML
jgi:hypothetical protein